MISRSWKKFLSSCEGVAVLGSLGRPANTYTALCTRPGASRVPAPAAFPWGTWLGEIGASWPRVLGEESGAGEQSKAPVCAEEQVSTAACTALPLLPLFWVSCWVPVACLCPSSPAEQTQAGRGGGADQRRDPAA